MAYLRSRFERLPLTSNLKHSSRKVVFSALFLASLSCLAQDSSQSIAKSETAPSPDSSTTVTIPAGTTLALVLTQPVQTRYIRRGDDIYAQITDPVDSGNQVVIPPGTFVQGTVDKIEHNGGRGEIRLQSMSITFPDGYVTPIPGPLTVESSDGYAIKDPGSKRFAGAIAMPFAGLGIGALIGHSVGTSQSTLTNTLPPRCVGTPPGCLTSSVTGPGSSGKDTAIGAVVGGAIGGIASLVLLTSSHHFYLDAGAPAQATLQHPVTLQQDEVSKAVKASEQHPLAERQVAPRPVPPPPDMDTPGIPGNPGTPPIIIPGAPGPDGVPGPPTIIPGTPPSAP